MFRDQFDIDFMRFDVYGSKEKKLLALNKRESERFITIRTLIKGLSDDESEYSCFELELNENNKYQVGQKSLFIKGKDLEIILLK